MNNKWIERLPLVVGAAGVLLLGVVGWCCLGAGFRETQVLGRVTLDDAPVGGAKVVFVPDNEKAPLVAQTDDDGRYQLVPNDRSIPRGKYKVSVTKLANAAGKVPTAMELENARAQANPEELPQNILPSAYEDHANSPLQFDIGRGTNTINLMLKKNP